MDIDNLMADKTVLEELGQRLARRRIAKEMTQGELATEAGVSKRTLERLEAGQSSQLLTVVRVLRALDMLDMLDTAIPETAARPMDVLKMKGKERKRVSTRKRKSQTEEKWTWGDEE